MLMIIYALYLPNIELDELLLFADLPSDPHTGGYVSNSPYNSLSIVTLLGSLFVATVVISSSTSSSR